MTDFFGKLRLDGSSFWRDRMELDFCKKPSHFPKEHPPTLRIFRRLESQKRFFQLSEEFGQSGQFFLRHDARPQAPAWQF